MDVFRPTPEWGPGDRSQKKLWLEKKRPRRKFMNCMICILINKHNSSFHTENLFSEVLQGYDNPTMAYPYYNYAGYGNYHNHMWEKTANIFRNRHFWTWESHSEWEGTSVTTYIFVFKLEFTLNVLKYFLWGYLTILVYFLHENKVILTYGLAFC